MYSSLALAIALWPATVTEHCPPQPNAIIVGVAKNSKQEFLYCEYFSEIAEHQFNVNYVRDEKIFATKELDYSISPYIPTIKQIDQRTGELREANIEHKNLQLTYKENRDKQSETSNFSLEKIDVVDAGFNNFVKSHWDELIAGEMLPLNFAAIANQKSLPLRVTLIPTTKCSHPKNILSIKYCFSVDIDNSFFRLLISGIKISYDQNQRLVQFDGLVNIQDDAKKPQNAIINYFYKEDYLTDTK